LEKNTMRNNLSESAPTDMPQHQVASRRILAIAFTVIVLDLLGGNLLAPVVPFLVRQYSIDALSVGLLSVIYAGGQFFAAPFLGLLSDRIGGVQCYWSACWGQLLGTCCLGSAVHYGCFFFPG
jgi:MFS family permease